MEFNKSSVFTVMQLESGTKVFCLRTFNTTSRQVQWINYFLVRFNRRQVSYKLQGILDGMEEASA